MSVGGAGVAGAGLGPEVRLCADTKAGQHGKAVDHLVSEGSDERFGFPQWPSGTHTLHSERRIAPVISSSIRDRSCRRIRNDEGTIPPAAPL